MNNEEFLADRFIEDIMDGKQSIALVVNEVKLPDEQTLRNLRVGEDVPVVFKVTTTEEYARELIDIGYTVRPEHPDRMKEVWDDEPDGMTWGDLLSMLNGHMRPMGPELEKHIRLTDDNDPHSPWFQLMGLKKDDDGWFIAIEEIQP
jgi:hypothetical protein